ncbi:TIM-barrel domain-containing protein [Reinekea blandensis]|nr:TIM-barrel domain-containing protein [Reinekea blandensis]
MTELQKHSSLAVQPELVLGQGRPVQKRIDDFGVPISSGLSTRLQHDHYPILAQQIAADTMRVCIGSPVARSFALLSQPEPLKRIEEANLIEWSWLPDAHWQVAVHRHRQGLRTSRGLYQDSEQWVHLYLAFPDAWPVYGLGEKTGELNKQGKRWRFWNSDVFDPHTEATDALYQSIPFMLMKTDQGWMGLLLDNPGETVIDFTFTDEVCLSAASGALDLYVFSGETAAEVIEAYTRLTGRPFLPPKWALGYHQSRHSYESDAEVRNIVNGFKTHDLPLDALYLDILYMDGYRVFTFDPERFGKAPELIDDLAEQGVRVVPIVDPGVKVDPQYRVYQQGVQSGAFVLNADQTLWKGQVWPGESVWPDFFQADVCHWWQDLHRYFTDMGVQGIWNDMNEPAVFNDRMTMDDDAKHSIDGEWVDHACVHNAYGLLMSQATANAIVEQTGQRPFVLTRAGYAGIQRSAAVWTGDNRSSWEHLSLSVPMLLNLGLSGVAFAGADIGGFMDDTRPELFTRWMQLGCFYPFMRNHCSIGMRAQEPWTFDEPTLARVRHAMHRRYKLLPYLYQLMRDANETGEPVMRPQFWYDSDAAAGNISDQFFIGSQMLVAPILREATLARAVRLPDQGNWFSVQENRLVEGNYHLAETGLDDIPLYLRAGSILPLAPYRASTARPLKELRLLVVDGAQEGRLLYRDDDGLTSTVEGNRYARLTFGYRRASDRIECHLTVDATHYQPQWQQVTLGVPESWRGIPVQVNGQEHKGRFTVDGLRCRVVYIAPGDWL